jgi:hypothetical protein
MGIVVRCQQAAKRRTAEPVQAYHNCDDGHQKLHGVHQRFERHQQWVHRIRDRTRTVCMPGQLPAFCLLAGASQPRPTDDSRCLRQAPIYLQSWLKTYSRQPSYCTVRQADTSSMCKRQASSAGSPTPVLHDSIIGLLDLEWWQCQRHDCMHVLFAMLCAHPSVYVRRPNATSVKQQVDLQINRRNLSPVRLGGWTRRPALSQDGTAPPGVCRRA